MQAVELATLEWVAWFRHYRLIELIGNVPPVEAEAAYHRQQTASAMTGGRKPMGLGNSWGGSHQPHGFFHFHAPTIRKAQFFMIVLQRPHGARLFFVLRGSVLPRIAPALATCTLLAVAVTLTHGFLLHWKVTLTTVPFSLIGLALAIFLGFRNNAAYDRYWEARKLWGDLIHRARSWARQWQSLPDFAEPAGAADRDDVRHVQICRTIAFAHALRHQLRDSNAAADMERLLPPGEVEGFAVSRLGTDYLLRRMGADLGACVRAGHLDARLAAEMDSTLSAMTAMVAGCERIKGTPIPFAYTLLLHRTATLYCFLLPFGLVDLIGLMTPVVVAIVAYTFFGLDAVGDEIEEPFGLATHHLPLSAICRTIEINLLEALGVRDLPEPLIPINAQLT